MGALGIPWYCDGCGKANLEYVTFDPSERAEAYRAIGREPPA